MNRIMNTLYPLEDTFPILLLGSFTVKVCMKNRGFIYYMFGHRFQKYNPTRNTGKETIKRRVYFKAS